MVAHEKRTRYRRHNVNFPHVMSSSDIHELLEYISLKPNSLCTCILHHEQRIINNNTVLPSCPATCHPGEVVVVVVVRFFSSKHPKST
jgi:hypothetical protein